MFELMAGAKVLWINNEDAIFTVSEREERGGTKVGGWDVRGTIGTPLWSNVKEQSSEGSDE